MPRLPREDGPTPPQAPTLADMPKDDLAGKTLKDLIDYRLREVLRLGGEPAEMVKRLDTAMKWYNMTGETGTWGSKLGQGTYREE